MALRFNWRDLGREDERQCEDFLNSAFAGVALPDFVGAISVSGVSFGAEPPEVQLLGIGPLSSRMAERLQADVTAFGDGDAEVAVKITYRGSASFRLHTELVVNQPAPGFARLPVTLAASALRFDGTARVAKVGSNVFLAFDPDDGGDGPLGDVKLAAEIGDAGQAVLRDASRIEHFIVEQLREIVRNRLVFPNLLSAGLAAGSTVASPSEPAPHAAAAAAAVATDAPPRGSAQSPPR